MKKDKPQKFKKLDERRRFIKFLEHENKRLEIYPEKPQEDIEPYAYAITQTLKTMKQK